MNKNLIVALLTFLCSNSYSQKRFLSWGQQNIENYTKEMYDEAQGLSTLDLLSKNINDKSWSGIFLTLNTSLKNYSKDNNYLKELANQITNTKKTQIEGTSRLIIWDRIISGELIFEGKGLVFDNDLFKVGGRANQLLQSLTKKNFGYVTINSTEKELEILKEKWLNYISNKSVDEYKSVEYKNAKIPEISSLNAVEALIISIQDNSEKDLITKNCLKTVYKLDKMPKEKDSPANYCNPDTYTFGYLKMLFGEEKKFQTKDPKWWLNFWNTNKEMILWNNELGVYEVKK